MKIALLSNIVVEILAKSLTYEAYIPAGHDTWQMEFLNENSVFNTQAFDAAFVLLYCKDAKKSWHDYSDGEAALYEWIKTLAAAIMRKPKTQFFITNLDIAIDVIRPVCSPQPERAWEYLWQSGIYDLVGKHPNVCLFDVKSLVEEHGRAAFYSPKMWYAGGMPYSLKGIKAMIGEIESLLGAQRRKKALMTDLDNTLWGGVAGEDGVEGIVLSPYKEGARFYDLQLRLAELSKTGAVLAIASKNNEEEAYSVIDNHPYMVLRRENFVATRINWESKAENVRQMAKELNIGLDSIVFLDDNPLEREMIRKELPEVIVVDFPEDTALLEEIALDIYQCYFRVLRVTEEDAKKTQMYRQETVRRNTRNAAVTTADYIRALEMTLDIHRMTAPETDRVVQLCNKTNQFNLTTKRYSSSEIIAISDAQDSMSLTIHSCDKFGDHGLIGVMIIKERGSCASIESFLLSCRVMGRSIEDHAVAAVVDYYKSRGFARVEALFIPTGKNKPVERLYDRLRFEVISCSKEKTAYAFNLEKEFAQPEQIYKKKTVNIPFRP